MSDDNAMNDNAVNENGKRGWPEGRKLTDLTPKTKYRTEPAPPRSYKRGKVKAGGGAEVEGVLVETETQFPAPLHRPYDRYSELTGDQLAELVGFCELNGVGGDDPGAMSWNQAARELGVNEMALKRIVESYRVGVVLGDGEIDFSDLQAKVLQLQYRVLNTLGLINQKTGAKLIERLDDEGDYPMEDKTLVKLYEVGVKGVSGVMKGLNDAAAVNIESQKSGGDSDKLAEIKGIFDQAKSRMEDGENING